MLRTLVIIVVVYYGFKLLAKYVFPFVLKRWMNKKMKQFQGGQPFGNQQKAQEFSKQREGEVKIKSPGKNDKPETDKMGDFIDYEEVD